MPSAVGTCLLVCTAVQLVIEHRTTAYGQHQQLRGHVREDDTTMIHSMFNAVWTQ